MHLWVQRTSHFILPVNGELIQVPLELVSVQIARSRSGS
jgi:hypothetical protein